VEMLGCYLDRDGQDNCLQGDPSKNAPNCPKPHGMRYLPYNLEGCYPSAAGGLYVKNKEVPPPPPCEGAYMSNGYCAQRCMLWAKGIPGMGSSFLAGTQDGFACFCGTEADTKKTLAKENEKSFAQCNMPCTTRQGGSKSAAGTAGEMCGG
jgi:hypothetical protein